VLELAILGLLKEQDLHGYELKRRLVDQLGLVSGTSFGSLYPALARLESAGAVKSVESRSHPVATIPHTGSLGGEIAAFRARKSSGGDGSRRRKVYGITPLGEELFAELLVASSGPSEDGRLFNLKLALARYLPADARIGLLERRRAQLADRVARLRSRLDSVRDRYAFSLIEHDRESAQSDLDWIDRMIVSERAGGSPTVAAPLGPELTTQSLDAPTMGLLRNPSKPNHLSPEQKEHEQ
jgi:DNA-binding PadR family transcriptional regulator